MAFPPVRSLKTLNGQWARIASFREEVAAAAIKAVIARQLANEMKKKKITKQRMAQLMKKAGRSWIVCSILTMAVQLSKAYSAPLASSAVS
jgi:hypothetical protein